MADVNTLSRALKRAHEAGDEAGARRLAQEIRSRRETQPAPQRQAGRGILNEQEDGAKRGTIPFINRGIADFFGTPVDLVNAGLGAIGVPTSDTPFLGSESIASGMRGLGVAVTEQGQQPETGWEYIGRGMGEAAGALVPVLGGARAMQGARGAMASGLGSRVMDPFLRTPATALGAEAMAGAGAGAGAAIADGMSEGDPNMRMLGEIGGAVVGGMGPYAVGAGLRATPVLGTAMRAAQKQVAPFTEAGAMERARDRVRSLAQDPDEARRRTMDESISNLSPAQRTGDERLMALERTVRDTDPPTDLAMRQRDAEAHQVLREVVREPAAGRTVEDSRQFIGRRLDDALRRMDSRVEVAARSAERKINQLTPERRASESSIIVREELETALGHARKEESRLWNLIPKNETAPTSASRDAYRRVLADTPRAQRDNIPEKARQFLDPNNSNTVFKERESIKELHGLYSAMREQSRQARAAGEYNTARISDDIADALLVDMGATAADTPAGRMINDAREYSRRLNEKFTRGNVGRVLGYAREGGDSLSPELTLDSTIGRGGIRAAVSADEIRQAATGSADAESAMQDYLRARFRDYTVRDGQFSNRRAQDFLRQNDELLDRFPGLKSQMADAEQAQGIAQSIERRVGARSQALRDPRQSRAAEFLNAPVDQEIQTILRSRDPGAAARELTRQTAKDTTGDATRGLKGAFVDYLMDRARTGQFDEAGEPFISGRALTAALRDNRTGSVANALLSTEERSRLLRVAQEFSRLETARGRLPSVGDRVIDDPPNNILSFLARSLAARQGAKMGQGTSGASLLTAHFASKRMQRILESLTNDRAEALIREAVTNDPTLFRTLLSESAPRTDAAANRIVETLTAITGTQVSGITDPDR